VTFSRHSVTGRTMQSAIVLECRVMSDIAWSGKYLTIGMPGVTHIPAHAFIKESTSTVLE
jgi:hypothetical protein